jgi:hypothetical protein
VTQPDVAPTDPEAWAEPRGPHLPDALTRVPVVVWPFVVVAVLAGLTDWSRQTSGRSLAEVFAPAALSAVSTASFALWGAAFFGRHPDGMRHARLVGYGVGVVGAYALVDAFRDPIYSAAFGALSQNEDLTGLFISSAVIGAVLQAILLVGIVLVAAGLRDARRVADQTSSRDLAIVLTLVAITAGVLGVASTLRFAANVDTGSLVLLGVNVVVTLATMLAWSYLLVVALAGWIADERPNAAWALTVLGAAATVGSTAVLRALEWLATASPPAAGFPPGYELAIWIGRLAPILVLSAFALGLPSTAQVEWEEIESTAPREPTEADPVD